MSDNKVYILRLANIMGLEIDKKQHQHLLYDALGGIIDQDDFLEYCRDKKEGIEYSNRVEKLDILATRYKKTINNIPTALLEKFSREIVNKFKIAEQTLRDNEATFSERGLIGLVIDHQQYFTNKEIELMDAVGGLNRLINLCELGTLYEELYETSVKKVLLKRSNNQLTDNQRRVKQIIGGTK